MFFFIVITATRRLKRHTPCKTSRQENGLSTVLLSFQGIKGRHKADLPLLPLQTDYKIPTHYHSTLTLFSNYRRNGQSRFTATTASLTNNRAVKSRHKKPVFCSSVLTALTRLQNTDLFIYPCIDSFFSSSSRQCGNVELSLYPFIFLVFTVFFVWITMWITCGYAVDSLWTIKQNGKRKRTKQRKTLDILRISE